MSSPRLEVASWRPRRWLLLVTLALAAHLALVSWLSPPNAASLPLARSQTGVRVISHSKKQAVSASERGDPTLFALVHSRGFSRTAWLTIPRFQYQVTNQVPPLHWLALPTEELADDFAEFVQTNLVTEDLISSIPTPALSSPTLPTPVVTSDSMVRVESGLSGRTLVAPGALPRQPDPILTNTVVRVLVDPAGLTLSAALLSGSGAAKADQDALNFAKSARFPLRQGEVNPGGFAFGTLVFRWSGVRWPNGVESPGVPALR
jgi:hypothetical protein